jgi:group I intron endonuclease
MMQEIVYDCDKDEVQQHFNCIYMYVNKINDKKYIGQAMNFKNRHASHVCCKQLPLDRAITKYGIENFKIVILKEDLTLEQRNEWEEYYISYYNTTCVGGCGYNIKSGGRHTGWFEGKTEEEQQAYRDKCREINMGENNPFYGRHHSKESKEKIRKALTGQKRTGETKRKISESKKGVGCKKIIQYTRDGEIVKEWESSKAAGEELGLNIPNIVACLKGRQLTCGGYVWKYAS